MEDKQKQDDLPELKDYLKKGLPAIIVCLVIAVALYLGYTEDPFVEEILGR